MQCWAKDGDALVRFFYVIGQNSLAPKFPEVIRREPSVGAIPYRCCSVF